MTEEDKHSQKRMDTHRRGWTLSQKRLNTLTKEYRDTLTEEAKHSDRSGWTLSLKRLNTLTEEVGHSHRRG